MKNDRPPCSNPLVTSPFGITHGTLEDLKGTLCQYYSGCNLFLQIPGIDSDVIYDSQ